MAAAVGIALVCMCALVLLILLIPLSFAASYRTGGEAEVCLRWLFFTFDLTKERPEKKPPPKRKKPKEPPVEEKPTAAKKPQEFSELLGVIVDLLSSLPGGAGMLVRNFVFYKIRLYLVVAEGDAADTAIAYGRVNAAVYSAYALALNFLRLEKPDIQIRPDFTAEEGKIDFEARARLTPLAAIGAALRIAGAFLVKTIRRRRAQPPKGGEGEPSRKGRAPGEGARPE